LPCGEDVERWLAEARDSLTLAFRQVGFDPPADVKALGEPMRYQDFDVLTAAELWASLAKPASFVARVVVSAQSNEHAVTQAKTMIRALYSMEDPRIGRDLRSRARVWTPQGRWSSNDGDATDLAEGEIGATQTGLRAAHVWARDLKTPLSNIEMERLATRSLIRDPDASLDVRLARAVTAVEGLTPRDLKLDDVPFRLWYHDAWERAHRLITNAVGAGRSIRARSPAPQSRCARSPRCGRCNRAKSRVPHAHARGCDRRRGCLRPQDTHRMPWIPIGFPGGPRSQSADLCRVAGCSTPAWLADGLSHPHPAA
jgi:hypothetical protein